MKKSIILVLIAAVMGACQEAKPRYFSSSPEIDEVKALINDYENGNWEGWISHYADTAKVAHNIVQGISPGEAREGLKETLTFMSAYTFGNYPTFYEMVVDDDNITWVYFWGTWEASVKDTDILLLIPVHLAAHMVDGKIAAEYGFYDTSILNETLEDLSEDEWDEEDYSDEGDVEIDSEEEEIIEE